MKICFLKFFISLSLINFKPIQKGYFFSSNIKDYIKDNYISMIYYFSNHLEQHNIYQITLIKKIFWTWLI